MATMRQTYSEALKNHAGEIEKKETDLKGTEPEPNVQKPRKGVRFDLETETFVTDDGVIVGDFAPKRTHPKSCLRPPATFPTFGAIIKTYPPCFREFPASRRKATPKATSKSWRKKFLTSRTSSLSSDGGVGGSTEPSFDIFVPPKLQGNAITGEEEEENRNATPVSPTVSGDFKKGFVDLFAPKPNVNGNTQDEDNLKCYNGGYNPENLARTTGGNHNSSSTIGEVKDKRHELPCADNGYTLQESPSDAWGRSQRGMTYADAVSRSRPSVQKGHSWW